MVLFAKKIDNYFPRIKSMQTKIYDDQLIVITGAAGFIGSSVVRHLNDLGFSNLLLVDDFGATDKWKNLVGKKYVEMISKHDLSEWLIGRESEIEAFIHLGACSSTVEADGDYLQENNYRFSLELAEFALHHGHRFIYASSAATYGMTHTFSDDHEALEDLQPLNLYGYSKHMFDLWLKDQGALDQVVGLKYFNIFGPNEYHKKRMASMVLHMTRSVLEDGVVRLFKSTDPKQFADGDQKRDFFYIKDAVSMTCGFLENDLMGIFNAGSGVASSWNQMARAVFRALGRKEHIEYFDMPVDLKEHYLNYTCADMSKYAQALTEKNLDVPAPISLDSAVEEYVKDYLLGQKRW